MGCPFSRAALFHSSNISNVTLSIFYYPYIKHPLGGIPKSAFRGGFFMKYMVDLLTTVWLTGAEPQAERLVEPVWGGLQSHAGRLRKDNARIKAIS